MSRRGTQASIVASPVLVGAVTVLVAIIAVFIAYNANAGLPFVPTYDVNARLPTGNKLVAGNEVRIGGFRVGVVKDIKPAVQDGRAVAEIKMKLDKRAEPLATDSTIKIRPRSALGLKYVEITPGRSKRAFAAGDTIPLDQSSEGLELEDVFKTFQPESRDHAREAASGFGEAFAGRGSSLNSAVEALAPFFRSLEPVATALSDPDTQLDQFFRQLGATAAQVAPVAEIQADLFANMATTFEAFSRDPAALQATIEKSPGTLDVATRSLRVQRPFLDDFADLSRRLRPAINELPRALPRINTVFRVGTPILPRSVELSEQLEAAFVALDDLFKNPNTLMAIRDLKTALAVTRPLIEFVAPYQTVCNYANYFFHALGEHQSTRVAGGTVQTQGVKLANIFQTNNPGNSEGSRPWDLPAGESPYGATIDGMPAGRIYLPPYAPAIDAQGNADCQHGQMGWMLGPLNDPWARDDYTGNLPDGTGKGFNRGVAVNNVPGLAGGTYKSRELGLNSLADVDKLRVP